MTKLADEIIKYFHLDAQRGFDSSDSGWLEAKLSEFRKSLELSLYGSDVQRMYDFEKDLTKLCDKHGIGISNHINR